MKKQNLQFKVDGGLEKVAALYTHVQNNKAVLEAYWNNPGALLNALSINPIREFQLSTGYKKLADKMDTIDFNKWNETFASKVEKRNCLAVQEKPFRSLWQSINGDAKDFRKSQTGNVNDLLVTVTVTSGSSINSKGLRKSKTEKVNDVFVTVVVTSGDSASLTESTDISKTLLANMKYHAQAVADQISWY